MILVFNQTVTNRTKVVISLSISLCLLPSVISNVIAKPVDNAIVNFVSIILMILMKLL